MRSGLRGTRAGTAGDRGLHPSQRPGVSCNRLYQSVRICGTLRVQSWNDALFVRMLAELNGGGVLQRIQRFTVETPAVQMRAAVRRLREFWGVVDFGGVYWSDWAVFFTFILFFILSA